MPGLERARHFYEPNPLVCSRIATGACGDGGRLSYKREDARRV